MSNAREIKNRISSVKDTMKITNAMYMISSSKLKRAKTNLKNTEPYFYSLQEAIVRVIKRIPEDVKLSYFDDKPNKMNKKKGYIVITGDKGLAGAYNNNVIKIAEEELKKDGNYVLFVAGNVGRSYFENKGINYDAEFKYTVQNPTLHRARVISGRIVQMFNEQQLDEIYIIYTRMINSMESKAELQKILPLRKVDFIDGTDDTVDETNYIPTPYDVLNKLIPNFVTGFIYGALTEAYSSEQNARMMAMEAATNNAKDMLKELSIIYNRARQAAITQEVTEVISGAKAQKRKKL
jgi:F-type H+-transporting ATPase subunit gamma